MGDRTIEGVLAGAMGGDYFGYFGTADGLMEPLHAATADGPVPSADGSLAVIRTDPRVRVWQSNDEWWFCDAYDHGPFCRRCERVSERVASRLVLLAAPAPADPEED